MSIDVSGIKQGQRTMWTAGDYPEVARRIESVGEYVAERAGAGPGIELLDVATGSGNVSIPAAQRGREGDGPRPHAEAARRAARTRGRGRRGGRARRGRRRGAPVRRRLVRPRDLVLRRRCSRRATTWLPPSSRALPARAGGSSWQRGPRRGSWGATSAPRRATCRRRPPGLKPPAMWGVEEHVRELFDGSGAELSFELRTVTFAGHVARAVARDDEQNLGPAVMAKAALEPQGRYEELRGAMLALYEDANEAADGTFKVDSEYLADRRRAARLRRAWTQTPRAHRHPRSRCREARPSRSSASASSRCRRRRRWRRSRRALLVGYRHIDTAAAYRNEGEVGEAIRASGLDRGEVFVTTQVLQRRTTATSRRKRPSTRSLERLGFDHVDLYLIHWPVPSNDLLRGHVAGLRSSSSARAGARTIGVSNFQPAHLRRLIDETGVTPAINQIELHPYLQQRELRDAARRAGDRDRGLEPARAGAACSRIPAIVGDRGRARQDARRRWSSAGTCSSASS